jgi:tetratricopeptide (TPR) repeat protein
MPSEPQSRAARPLPEGYYADNFEIVLDTAVERYGDLLHPEELDFYRGYQDLGSGARRLYVRLISRRPELFRRDRLHYPEIPELDAAITDLLGAGFADRAEGAEPEEILGLLLRGELAGMLRDLTDLAPGSRRKEELLETLLESVEPVDLEAEVRRRIEILRPLHREHLVTFRLLFFGNLTQDWTEFVLRDLGVVRFEPYELRRDLRLFPDRAAVDHTLLLRQTRSLIGTFLRLGELEAARELAAEVWENHAEWHPSVCRLVDDVLVKVARELERRGDLEEALSFYEAAEAPPARERRARVLARLGRPQEALSLCGEIAGGHRDETERAFAPRFAHRMRRQLGERVAPRPRRRRPRRQIEIERLDGVPVEVLALDAVAGDGHEGFFSENWLWRSLFGLAFWDIVFAPVAGAFQHPFQYGPLDLHSPDFRAAREKAIEERLAELEADPRPGPRLLRLYDEKRDVANRLVSWGEDLRPLYELALSCLNGRHLAAVCDRLSRDVHRYRRGLPDLFVVDGKTEAGFRLYEVKGPGDQLRPEQSAWIDYLNDHGIPAAVLRVRWQEDG